MGKDGSGLHVAATYTSNINNHVRQIRFWNVFQNYVRQNYVWFRFQSLIFLLRWAILSIVESDGTNTNTQLPQQLRRNLGIVLHM